MKNLLFLLLSLLAYNLPAQIIQKPQMNITVTQGPDVRTYGEPLPGVFGQFNNADIGEISPAKPTLILRTQLVINEPMGYNTAVVKYFIKPTDSHVWLEYTVARAGNDYNILYYNAPLIDLALYGVEGLNHLQVYWTINFINVNTGQNTLYVFDNNGVSYVATYTKVVLIPVTLIDFQVSAGIDLIELNWNTAIESNNKEFQIERSLDGQQFEKIGTVTSKGNNSGKSYQFFDKDYNPGNLYYRLKQVDYDGNYSYSPTRLIRVKESFKILPNPVHSSMKIMGYQAGTDLPENREFIIIDAAGNIVLKSRIVNNLINVSALKPGKYFIKMINGNTITTAHFIKL